jgi:hypothetical protein
MQNGHNKEARMKDHRKAIWVNELTALAKTYAGTQQLRSRIHHALLDALKEQDKDKEELLDEMEEIDCLGQLSKLLRKHGRR